MVLGDAGRLLLPRSPAMEGWQPGETEAWVLSVVANLFSVKLDRLFLNIREIGVTRENKRSCFFFKKWWEIVPFEKLPEKSSLLCQGVCSG